MATIKGVILVVVKVATGIVVALIALIAYGTWSDRRQNAEYQAKLTEIMKPDPQNWQIVNATKGDTPAAWAINRATGVVMYCTADGGVSPSCMEASR